MSSVLSIADDEARTGPPKPRSFTLAEVAVALAVAGLLMAVVMAQWIESTRLALKAAETTEHSRSTREFMARLGHDMRNAQTITIHTAFADRTSPRRDGETGNYLLLREISINGTFTRTVGYYLVAAPDGQDWMLYRHDSRDGVLAADALPDISTAGQHRLVARAVRLPASADLFRCLRDRAVTIRGEFGADDDHKIGRTEFVQCTFSTRS